MSALTILIKLVNGGMTPEGACAMGGNMMAESSLKSTIAQRGLTDLTDYQYTQYTDNKFLPPDTGQKTIDFVYDGVGYGLCQWTEKSRKNKLLDFVAKKHTSVGDEATQVEFCIYELQTDYPALWEYLKTTTDVYTAAARICKEYERPAVNNIEFRAEYANQFLSDYGDILRSGYTNLNKTEDDPDKEPRSYFMGMVRYGEHTPEAAFLMAKLMEIKYDVLWEGLDKCVRDFQQKRGLAVDGIVGEKTWGELLK